jgi:hypothetical protein
LFGPELYVQRQHKELSVFMLPVGVNNPTLLQTILFHIGHGAATLVAAIPVLYLAQRLIRQTYNTDPFTPFMARKLQVLGFVVLAGGAVAEAAKYIACKILLDISLPHDISQRWSAQSGYEPTYWWLLLGLAIMAFAEIVKRGCKMRAELDEVI